MTFYLLSKFFHGTRSLTFLMFFFSTLLFSQTGSSLINLAQSYEDDGLYEKALPIYQDLYKKDPANIVILDRLKNVYRILGKNDELTLVISSQLKSDSVNIGLLCELADVFYKSRKMPEAQNTIQKVISIDPSNENTYRLAATVLMSNRRFDEVERIYQTARKNLGNDKLFILEMANLLAYKTDYYLAAKEFLRLYSLNPGSFDYVKNQILQFPDDSKDNRLIIKAIQEELDLHKDDYALNKFLIDFYFRNEEYELAFEQSKILDAKRNKNGAEILRFANMTFDNRLFTVAQKAYAYFLTLYPNTPQAEMGIAQCYEGIGSDEIMGPVSSDSVSLNQKVNESFFSDKAIHSYQDIIVRYPNSEWSAEAYFHVGEIRLRKFFDVQEAYSNFSKAIDSKNPYRMESMFRRGECYLIEGKLDQALNQYEFIKKETRDALVLERAQFREAEVYFFLQQFDSCDGRMREIIKNQKGLYVNDALSYVLLIQENRKDPELFKMYAKADFYFIQKRYSEATALLSEIITSDPTSGIVDDALLKTGMISSERGEYKNAISVYRNIVDRVQSSPLADLSLKKIGEIFDERLGMPQEAIKAYKELLLRYPKSIYGNQVRKRMRELEYAVKKAS